MRKFFLPVAILTLSSALAADEGGVFFQVKKPEQKAVLASPYTLNMDVSYPSAYSIAVNTAAQKSDNFEILSISRKKTASSPAATQETIAIKILPFDIGISTFPALSWTVITKDTTTLAVSPEIPLEILPVSTATAGGGADIIDIRPPYSPFNFWWLLLILALAALGWYIWKKYRNRLPVMHTVEAAPDNRPPNIKALDQIEALLMSQLWEEGKFKIFYSRLADILRGYIGEIYSMDTYQLTSGDICRRLNRRPDIDQSATIRIKTVFASCDMVKFAKYMPSSQEKENDIARTREIIEMTAPKPPEHAQIPQAQEKQP